MQEVVYLIGLAVALLFGLTSAKWALDLGLSQLSQILYMIAGLFLGPLVLLILYTRLIHKKKQIREPGSQWIGTMTEKDSCRSRGVDDNPPERSSRQTEDIEQSIEETLRLNKYLDQVSAKVERTEQTPEPSD